MVDNHWRLDRRVPLAVILAMILQAVAALVWATKLDARVAVLEETRVENRMVSAQVARVEERIEALRGEIAGLRERIEERLPEHKGRR